MSVIFNTPFELSSLNGDNGFTLNGVSAGDISGISVAPAGDINGDGVADLLIGASDASPGGHFRAGASYVVFGKKTPWSASLELSSLDGSNGFVLNGLKSYDNLGRSVASAGDFNGDGIGDIIVGALGAAAGGRVESGASYVVFGKKTAWSASVSLSNLNGTHGFVINGKAAGEASGSSVASAGDFNGDGIGDIIIGAPKRERSSVVFGRRTPWNATFELSALNGKNGFVIKGTSGYSGQSVASAGDFNGDGIVDLIIGADNASPNFRYNIGTSYVVYGRQMPWNATFDLSSLNGINGFAMNGVHLYEGSGGSVAAAGDINGDGIGDIIIGASVAAPGQRIQAGSSYVVFGHKKPRNATFELSALNGSNGFVINGVGAYSRSGISVASAGDINGDGIKDLVIGAFTASVEDRPKAGAGYIVLGKQTPWSASLELAELNGINGFALYGAADYDYTGASATYAGDINGDGLGDLIIGAYAASPGGRASAGSTHVVFGKNTPFPEASTGTSDTSTGVSESTGTSITSSATRNKPLVLSAVQGTVSSIGYLGTELLSRISQFRLKDTVEVGKTENIESSETPTSSTDNSKDDSGSRSTLHSNGFKIPTLSMNDYLSIIPYVSHYARKYSPFTLPWNKVRTLSSDEIKTVEELQSTLKASIDARQNQTTSRAERSGMFADRSQFINAELQTLRAEITQILKSKQASSSQITGITDRIQRVDERIHELSKLNKSLKHLDIKLSREERRRPHHQTLSQIHHDPVSGALKQRFIEAESREGIELVMNSTKPYSSSSSKTLLFSSMNIAQSQAQQSASQSFLENIPARKAVGC